ncbi:MAG: pilus assembly protein [Desulfovibrionaceae bacterium]|nr:pilus assembly protein [Desulfovibrionaceae bacterium]
MRTRDKGRRGTAAVEFALALPILALLILLVAEGSHAMHTYSALVEASREGARHVLMQGDDADVDALVSALVADLDQDALSTDVVTDPVANTVTVKVAYNYKPFGSSGEEGMLGDDNDDIQFVAQTTMPLP